MSDDIFAKIGDIKGESTDDKHKDEIQLLSWSWNVSHTIPAGNAGQAGGKASFSTVEISHRIDKASPQLLAACAKGKYFPAATISVRKIAGEYLIIRLSDVLITRVAQGSADDNTETVGLSYDKVELEYRPQKPDGSLDAAVQFKFDIKANL
jgi:type VI secretion system secreted protein Hcp